MRYLRWLAVATVAFAVGGGVLGADDDAPGKAGTDGWLAQALGALRVRMEARLEQARILERHGRADEALEALRGIDALFDAGLAEIRALRRPGAADEALPVAPHPTTPRVEPEPAVPTEPPRSRPQGRTVSAAIDNALAWLATHQSPDGRWEAAGFGQWCDGRSVPPTQRPDGMGSARHDVGVTGLATLAFLGAGKVGDAASPHREVVSRALAWLKSVQDPEGCFGPRTHQHYFYGHVYATLAAVEAYAATGSALWKESAQKAIDFLLLARNPYFGWRYGVKPGDNDTSVTAASVLALASARLLNRQTVTHGFPAPFVVEEEAFAGALAWVEKMTDKDYGRVGYIQPGSGPARPQALVDRFPTDRSESMTAAGLVVRAMAGEALGRTDATKRGLMLLRRLLPRWDVASGDIDMYYWYFGTLATYQAGGEVWRVWRGALEDAAVPSQRQDGDACGAKGSWDPVDPWGPEGGRVYSTALMTLALEVTTRAPAAGGAR